MKTSKTIDEICKALVEAQTKLTNPKKNKTVKVVTNSGKSYSYSYAELGSIIDETKPVLEKNGLAVIQGTEPSDVGIIITTRLIHTSGQWIQSKIKMSVSNNGRMNDNQAMGSSITYGRRYALSALLNISADDDDDGQSSATTKQNDTPRASNSTKTASPKQVKFINTLISNLGKDRDKVKEYYKVKSLNDLTISQASELIEVLQNQATSIH